MYAKPFTTYLYHAQKQIFLDIIITIVFSFFYCF